MIDDAEFARRLRMVRAYLDLTLAQAGEHLGVSPSQLSTRESADESGMRFRPADRLYMATIYCQLAGWPMDVFTDEEMPPIPFRERPGDGDDLEAADVVELVEADLDDDGGTAERP